MLTLVTTVPIIKKLDSCVDIWMSFELNDVK